jgi:hypothetical protein
MGVKLMKKIYLFFDKQSALHWGSMLFLIPFLGLVLTLQLKMPKPTNRIAFIITFLLWGMIGLPEIVTQQIIIGNRKFSGVIVRLCGILCLVWGWGVAVYEMLLLLNR